MPSPAPSRADAALPQGFLIPRRSAPELPLAGLTLLAVEDSRYASEALRLLCQRSGARLRRADTLASARAHLGTYRPDVVIVDLGLPDGRGEGLIRNLIARRPRPLVVLGTSGDPDARADALAAGADGFLAKPIVSLAGFCNLLLAHLPALGRAVPMDGAVINPDPLALRDDLVRAARLLAEAKDAPARRYLAGFVQGIARHAQDEALAVAARGLTPDGAETLRRLIEGRLSDAAEVPPCAF